MTKKRTLPRVEKTLADRHRARRRMPADSEMTGPPGVRSRSAAASWVKKLLNRGRLEKDDRGFLRSCRGFLLPLAGAVAAGFPSPAEEELRDQISFDDYLVTRPESSFLLRVQGDSMIGEGIKEGDLVIVEKGRRPRTELRIAGVVTAVVRKYHV